MDDPRTDAPELELTAHADETGEDTLQVTPADSVSGMDVAAALGDSFAVASSAAPVAPAKSRSAPAAKPAEKTKSGKPPVQLSDDQFVAALLGQPRPDSKKSKKSKPAEKAVAKAARQAVETSAPHATEAGERAVEAEAGAMLAERTAASAVASVDVAIPSPVKAEAAPAAVADVPPEIIAPPNPELPSPAPASAAAAVAGAQADKSIDNHVIKPRPRPAKPAGPLVATAPVTTIEPEILPAVPLINLLATASSDAVPLPADALLAAELPPESAAAPDPAGPTIGVFSGVTMHVSADPVAAPTRSLFEARRIVDPVAAATAATSVFAKVAEGSEPQVPVATQPPLSSVFLGAAFDADAIARDFAIPVPVKSAAPLAPKQSEHVERIEVKPAVFAPDAQVADPMPSTGAWWTLPLMFLGIVMIACALIVPVADDNHRAAYELARIERDVAHFRQQADVNESFLARVSTDPAMAERLAMRQLNMIRPNEKFAALKEHHAAFGMSPFALVSVDAPARMPAYRPIGGFLSRWFLSPRCQIYFAGLGLLLVAAGVVFGGGGKADADATAAVK